MNSMIATSMSQYGSDSAMQARINGNNIFSNAINRSKWVMFLQKLVGKQNKLQTLSKVKNSAKPNKAQNKDIVTVSINKIVGSESRAHDFDKQFRPLVSHTRDRWVGVAIAYRRGINLPPVELIQVGDEYYVRDGHHRISVAKTYGQATIEARIVYKMA